MASRFEKYLSADDRATVEDTRAREAADRAALADARIHAAAIAGYSAELDAADHADAGDTDAETTALAVADALADDIRAASAVAGRDVQLVDVKPVPVEVEPVDVEPAPADEAIIEKP